MSEQLRSSNSRSLIEARWFKAKASGGGGNACVEIAHLTDAVGLRDSKDTARPAHVYSTSVWNTFLTAAKHGEFDRP